MSEFTGLDLEMVFENDYHKVVDMIDRMFLFVINLITSRYVISINLTWFTFANLDLF